LPPSRWSPLSAAANTQACPDMGRLRITSASRAALLAAFAGCGVPDATLPPRGEALIVVDTDLAVPRFAGQLRIDVYSADARHWYESRVVTLLDPREWPASFSVYSPDGERVALVRLRAYPAGKERDYLGERYLPRPVGLAPTAYVPDPHPV